MSDLPPDVDAFSGTEVIVEIAQTYHEAHRYQNNRSDPLNDSVVAHVAQMTVGQEVSSGRCH